MTLPTRDAAFISIKLNTNRGELPRSFSYKFKLTDKGGQECEGDVLIGAANSVFLAYWRDGKQERIETFDDVMLRAMAGAMSSAVQHGLQEALQFVTDPRARGQIEAAMHSYSHDEYAAPVINMSPVEAAAAASVAPDAKAE